MKFRIYFRVGKGIGYYIDYFDVEGETIEEVREKAFAEEKARGLKEEQCWSKELWDE